MATHLNTWADALSRLHAPDPAQVPEALQDVPRRGWPDIDDLFKIGERGAPEGS